MCRCSALIGSSRLFSRHNNLQLQLRNTKSTNPSTRASNIPINISTRALTAERLLRLPFKDIHSPDQLSIPLHPKMAFSIFPQLPAELRHRVWRYAANVPHDISIELCWRLNRGSPKPAYRFRADTRVPPLLHACHESRNEVKKIYQTCVENEGKPRIYINPVADSIFITLPHLMLGLTTYQLLAVLNDQENLLTRRLAHNPDFNPPHVLDDTPWQGLNPVIGSATIDRTLSVVVIKTIAEENDLFNQSVRGELDRLGCNIQGPPRPFRMMHSWCKDWNVFLPDMRPLRA